MGEVEVNQIIVGKAKVGIVGLDTAFEEVWSQGVSDPEALAEIILQKVKARNYIPKAMEDEYKRALLEEYRVFTGEQERREAIGELEIRVLGFGCYSCEKLYQDTRELLAELGMVADLEYITDLGLLAQYGPFTPPALVINGEMKSMGRIPTKAQLRRLREQYK